MLVDVFEERLHERRPHFLDAFFEPYIVMEEVSLTGQYSQIDSKVIVLAVDNLD